MNVLAAVLGVLLVLVAAGLWRRSEQLRAERQQVVDLEASVERSARQRAEAARERGRLTLSLGAIEDGVIIFDEHGAVAYRNEPASGFLSARHGDVLVEEAITALARAALRGRGSEEELEVFGPPRRTLSLRAVPLDDASYPTGSTAGALIVVEDTSARRRLENVRRDFVANISHELKTPVGALSLLAETLAGEDEPEVMRRLASRIGSEAFRVGHTIDDLLELSRLEVSSVRSEEALAVETFVAEAVERVWPAADQRGITVEVDAVDEELRVHGERRQLVSALANLLDNAVKYSEPGSPVEVRARPVVAAEAGNGVKAAGGGAGTTWVDVEVRDYGIGIPRRDLERIFERFYRVDRARSRETGGTGLGLAIVRHVASNHRGEVRVESREGEGSRFTLRLPAAQVVEVEAEVDADAEVADNPSAKEPR